jgi:hypothetical protein
MNARNLLLASAAVAALAGCADMPGSGPPGYGWYVEAPPIAEPAPSPPIASAPVNPAPLDLGPVNPPDSDDTPPAPVHPRRHYRQPPVTEQPDDEPPVTDLSPPSPPAPEPDQRSLWDRLGLPHITTPANGNGDDCVGAWRICHFL